MKDLVLPAFQLDCRDWLVVTPASAGLPDEVDGAPLLAVLSTAVIDTDSMRSANAVLTVGLLDDDVTLREVTPGGIAAEIVEDEPSSDARRYVLPAPEGNLALVAEISAPEGIHDEVERRVEALIASFRWAA
jgi:hypothetical protein